MHAEGSVLVEFGNTKVLCNATFEDRVPGFLKGKGEGWVTAEYGMLPRSTNSRMRREAASGKQGGRTLEIQRLIGRSLRAVVDRKALGERSITIDCDVIQADGGTRTASITGAYIAIVDAINKGQVYSFVSKPWNEEELRTVIRSGYYLNRSRVQNAEQGAEVLAMLEKLAGQVEALDGQLAAGTPEAISRVQQELRNLREGVLQERERYAQWMDRLGK